MALLALVGTLLIGEYLAGAVITVMLGTGRVIEARAAGRARRELRGLLERAPRVATATSAAPSRTSGSRACTLVTCCW